MGETRALVKTVEFQLDVRSDNESLLSDAALEARSAYNETVRLAKRGVERTAIPNRVAETVDLVKNTTQRIVAKALTAVDHYEKYDDFGEPSHTKSGTYPLRANYGEGYTLSPTEGNRVAFRISAKPYRHVTGVLRGADSHVDIVRSAISGDEWNLGTAEVLVREGTPELHVTVTNTERTVRDMYASSTVIGVDVNEDNVALAALTEDGVTDSVVIDFPEIKYERHRYFTIRNRVQVAGKRSAHRILRGREERFVRDRLHKLSRHVVDWCGRFASPCIVFEDLKELRDSIDYGAQMNRRLHSLPFRSLQSYISYKASFEGIPSGWINPAFTSQECSLCGHTERANRTRKRFKCRSCAHQDHSDRNASVNIAVKGVENHLDWTVPALNTLPQVRKMRRRASGAVDAPTVTRDTDRSHHTDGVTGVLD